MNFSQALNLETSCLKNMRQNLSLHTINYIKVGRGPVAVNFSGGVNQNEISHYLAGLNGSPLSNESRENSGCCHFYHHHHSRHHPKNGFHPLLLPMGRP